MWWKCWLEWMGRYKPQSHSLASWLQWCIWFVLSVLYLPPTQTNKWKLFESKTQFFSPSSLFFILKLPSQMEVLPVQGFDKTFRPSGISKADENYPLLVLQMENWPLRVQGWAEVQPCYALEVVAVPCMDLVQLLVLLLMAVKLLFFLLWFRNPLASVPVPWCLLNQQVCR